jgi:hypothetical protein
VLNKKFLNSVLKTIILPLNNQNLTFWIVLANDRCILRPAGAPY